MTSDPLQRLRDARPPLPDWTSSPDGRDQWQVTERRGLDGTFPSGAGPTPRPRRTRWLGLLAAAALLVSGTAVATAAITHPGVTKPTSSELRGYHLPILGVRTGADGRSLIVDVVATPCVQTNQRVHAVETATTITVSVTYDPVYPTRTDPGCLQLPLYTTLTAQLDDVLGSRVVLNGISGRILHPFDGGALLRPTWLPPGYRLTYGAGDSQGLSWYQEWMLPTQPYFTGNAKSPCLSRTPDIAVSQGPPFPDRTGNGYVTLPGRVTIDGVPATLTRDRRGQTFLSWSPPNLPAGQAIVVISSPTCSNEGSYLPTATLLHVARSLR